MIVYFMKTNVCYFSWQGVVTNCISCTKNTLIKCITLFLSMNSDMITLHNLILSQCALKIHLVKFTTGALSVYHIKQQRGKEFLEIKILFPCVFFIHHCFPLNSAILNNVLQLFMSSTDSMAMFPQLHNWAYFYC